MTWRAVEAPRSLRATLAAFRSGARDPTTRLGPQEFLRATLTPDGPATLHLTWRSDPAPPDADGLDAVAWGPGADWMLDRVDDLTGRGDSAITFDDGHRAVVRALHTTRAFRLGRSATLYHELLPTILAQRITGREALRQWRRLCLTLGQPAPGPPDIVTDLQLPPAPDHLRRRPAWWFHPLGIEERRARTLLEVARHSPQLFALASAPASLAAAQLGRISGVGPWTVGSVLGPALGDADAVPVGDYHLPSAVAWAVAGEARADDDRMLELLAPYAGQRGRVVHAVVRTFGAAPKFGSRRRILPMSEW